MHTRLRMYNLEHDNWYPAHRMQVPWITPFGAIWGGTTTIVDFAPYQTKGDLVAGIHDFLKPWEGNAYTDYSTHCIYSSKNTPDAINRFGELIPQVSLVSKSSRLISDLPRDVCIP
ncbi:MAG: hypothetical protein Ct9H300mP27_02940 [Chloroflexota bacterium]|nr:MAG: hypothetical protein Ct9H300mP27_02940 [Chloroflexota bacterium]